MKAMAIRLGLLGLLGLGAKVSDATNEFFVKMEKLIKDFHVEPEKIKDKSSKDSHEDKEELQEESVTLQEQ